MGRSLILGFAMLLTLSSIAISSKATNFYELFFTGLQQIMYMILTEVEMEVAETVDVAPQVVDVASQMADIAPQVVDLASQMADVAPQVVDVTSQVADVAPHVVDVAPQVVDVASQVVNVAPDVVDVAPELSVEDNIEEFLEIICTKSHNRIMIVITENLCPLGAS